MWIIIYHSKAQTSWAYLPIPCGVKKPLYISIAKELLRTTLNPTLQSGRRCLPSPEEPGVDIPKRDPSIAVVVPAPPWMRTRVTRSTRRASARKRRLQHDQASDSDHFAAGLSIEVVQQKTTMSERETSCAAMPAPAGRHTSVQSGCSPQNQKILGRAILIVQSEGSKPANLFTFMPEPVQILSS